MSKYPLAVLLLLACLFSRAQDERTAVVTFQDAYKRVYTITQLDSVRPQIDGKLDEAVWQHRGEWSAPFSQVIPFERVHTGSWTRMKIFYDDQAIYIGVYCKDEHPATMNAFIGNRDEDRKSTRRTPVTNAHLVCRLMLE